MVKKKFYITTTAPYVNADPHIGFALEIIQADVMARFKKLTGFNVAFGFGTDEHGLKIYRKALEEKKEIARSLLDRGLSRQEISEITGLKEGEF